MVQQLDDALARKSQDLHELNKIGVALSAQRDITKLLEMILWQSRAITAADAGSLYLVQRGRTTRRRPTTSSCSSCRRTTPCP